MVENLTSIPVGIYKQPPQHDGNYLSTLQAWGDLPNVLHLKNVARLLGVLCTQNQQAIYAVLKGAAISGEIEIFGWKLDDSGGRFEKNYIRRLDTLKPLQKRQDGENIIFSCEIVPGEIHWDAIGIRPADAVRLLIKRGRKVPSELLELLPIQPTEAAAPPSPAPVAASGASDRVKPVRTKYRTWRDVTETYLFDTFKAEQYPTAKDFYKILERKAGAGSPFDRGTGPNVGSLFAREVCEKVTFKMIQGAVTEIRKKL